MNTKSKGVIVILVTLVIGIVLGILAGGFFRQNMLKDRVARFRSPDFFIERLEKIVQPTAEQSELLREILREHHEKMFDQGERLRDQMRVMNDSLFSQLDTVLTEEQITQLKQRMERMRPFPPDRRDRMHPRREGRRRD